MMFNRIIIFGLGLIGGSLAKDVKNKGLANKILAYDVNDDQLKFALENKIIDESYDIEDQINEDDLVIIATPLNSYKEIAEMLPGMLHKNTTIIDVGSVKSFVRVDIFPLLKDFAQNFVPCHPIAGLEKSGVENAIDNLFQGKKLIITQNNFCNKDTIKKISLFWQNIGADVKFLDDQQHDKIFALTSHMPQLISNFLKNEDLDIENKEGLINRHLRLENSNVKIWQDIFNINVIHLKNYINIYNGNIDKIKGDIINKNYKEIFSLPNNLEFKLDYEPALDQDFRKILCRVLAVLAYVSIEDIVGFKDYFGTGFKDFTIILSCLKYLSSNEKKMTDFIDHNQEYLVNFLDKLKQIKI